MCGLLSALASLVVEHMLEALRLQKLGLPGPRAQAQELWCMGFIAPRHVGPSWIRNQTCVYWTDRWILYHWATKEVLCWVLNDKEVTIQRKREELYLAKRKAKIKHRGSDNLLLFQGHGHRAGMGGVVRQVCYSEGKMEGSCAGQRKGFKFIIRAMKEEIAQFLLWPTQKSMWAGH